MYGGELKLWMNTSGLLISLLIYSGRRIIVVHVAIPLITKIWLTVTVLSCTGGVFFFALDVAYERNMMLQNKVLLVVGFSSLIGGMLFAVWFR